MKIERDTLKENHRKIILLRYFEDMTQSQVAEIMGVSQVQVSRLEMKARSILKKKLT
ncbi:MAG TPA: sigma-70 family RNA polymerase sigma factor [Clostridiaceae bacterium]